MEAAALEAQRERSWRMAASITPIPRSPAPSNAHQPRPPCPIPRVRQSIATVGGVRRGISKMRGSFVEAGWEGGDVGTAGKGGSWSQRELGLSNARA